MRFFTVLSALFLFFQSTAFADSKFKISKNEISITSRIVLFGEAATQEAADYLQKSINSKWNNAGSGWSYKSENIYTVKVSVEVSLYNNTERSVLSLAEVGALSRRQPHTNFIELQGPELSGSYLLYDSFTQGVTGVWRYSADEKSKKSYDLAGAYAHEFGHLMGLDERYHIDSQTDEVSDDTGWENNIMSYTAQNVEQKNIDEVATNCMKIYKSTKSNKYSDVEEKAFYENFLLSPR